MDTAAKIPALMVYHGSPNAFEKFTPGRHGIFFASSRDTAAAYAQGHDGAEGSGYIVEATIKMTSPVIIDRAYLDAFEIAHAAEVDAESKTAFNSISFPDAFEDSETWARDLVFDFVRRAGHDGVIIVNDLLPVVHKNGDWESQRSYVVFSPTQVQRVDDPAARVEHAQKAIDWVKQADTAPSKKKSRKAMAKS